MRRHVAIAALVGLALGGVGLWVARPSTEPLEARAVAQVEAQTRPVAPLSATGDEGEAPDEGEEPDVGVEEAPWARDFQRQAEEVRDACGLDVRTTCDGDVCVAVTTAPDLDHITGWVRLLGQAPRFVLSAAARDLGVPTDLLPCGVAIAGLPAEAGTATVELPDGTEIWCTPTGRGQPWSAAQRTLCHAAAIDLLGQQGADFTAEHLRILVFDR